MSDHLSVQRDHLEPKADGNIKGVSAKLEELIAQFHGSAGFEWYEVYLRKVLEDIRRLEEIDQWLEDRKRVGKLIDPATAEVTWWWAKVLDPYGVLGAYLPEEYSCAGREFFARSPESDGWVLFDDLPDETIEALRARGRGEYGAFSLSVK
jgi:hypothetical protein